ncbi:hydantoinase B/oxoprolinase family protein [Mesorhizobium sp. SP-1A]|uniref:hydantoinase B/oxoprolinase family protein n=1 Tax=Mesorhizobium sp. SP-1A TaxID=3077840 RepID=UPI0028F6CEBB|nr:hydantoinase B/oxoprolinase family protein [Mesorhizobium sp. SP-1A]
MSKVADIIDRDVFQYQLAAIAEEMSAALRRSAFSPIIWDMLDYSCALVVPHGEMLAQADTIPAQLGILTYALRGIVKEIPLESWRPGDVLVCNDPYRGCTHTPDIVLLSPVFHGDELIAITATVAHHVDIGGKLPSTTAPDNLELFAEGLIFPPMHLVREGVQNETAFRFISANVRNPRACTGDIRAQIAGCRTGERRVAKLLERYGVERFKALASECLAYGERFMRNAIAAIPDVTRSAEIWIEDDVSSKAPVRLAVTVAIRGDEIEVDFSGTDMQRRNALNCPAASTCSMTLYAIRCVIGMETLSNGGCNRPISIKVPAGSFLNPHRPAAVGNRHYAQQAVADVVLKALADLVPERSAAGCHISFPSFRAGGFDTRKEVAERYGEARYFIVHDIIGGGMGGHASGDGLQAVDTHGGNCGLLSAEVFETTSPVRIRRSELIETSGGTGEHRGGLAMRRDYELLADDLMVSVFFQQGNDRTAPWGFEGGGPGRPAGAVLNPGAASERRLTSKEIGLPLRAGDVVRLESAGGGGWGEPARRDPSLAARDADERYA